ncbi:hypothetical protein [Streptomyces sp. CA-210063]|uniref:hypothetical protein n=1 Tax=Streptomyces sp. CA-210063 TaxID=2801029 RepID=UPI0027D46257|nr:hypothetical protein [Streptomyces sp. CA-210063]
MSPDALGGRGLTLVELCADAWGSFALGQACGKVVWFELAGVGSDAFTAAR